MNYAEARAYLDGIEDTGGMDFSLGEVVNLSERMGRPDRRVQCIHIAGTNGKGSVGNFICQALALAGYRVGRFSSPAVLRYGECIQKITVQGGSVIKTDISEEEVAEAVTVLRRHCDAMVSEGFHQPTVFEIETVMAFQKFADWEVEAAVVECGLGGRLDATNIMEHPLQCVFTSISLDHTGILGDSLEQIAREKYGIIVKGTQVVSLVSHACGKLLTDVCKNKGAELTFLEEESLKVGDSSIQGTCFSYRGREYRIGQPGLFQVENAALAVEALEILRQQGYDRLKEEHICEGLLTARWRGRLDIISDNPVILLDGAHNPAAVERLVESLETYFPGERFDFIFGVFREKDYQRELGMLLPLMRRVYTVTAPGKRGLSGKVLEEELFRQAQGRQDSVEVCFCPSMEQACSLAVAGLDAGRKLVVCGSLSIVGEACRHLIF